MRKPAKLAIIGMGYLMEYLRPCYSLILGGEEHLAEHVIATTMDARAIEEKRQRFPFDILLGQNGAALERMQPDILLFAPPPDAVPGIVEDTLIPYYTKCRSQGRPLPEIYAFPPSPHADWYLEKLGPDVLAVNIIPKTESGKKDEELNMLSFAQDAPWPQESLARLMEFCSPMGGCEILSGPVFYSQIGGRCVSNILPWVFFTAADSLKIKGVDTDHRQMARYVKEVLTGREAEDQGLPFALRSALAGIARLLRKSVVAYLESAGLKRDQACKMVKAKLKADLDLSIQNSRMDIVRQVKCYATKGGISELALLEYGVLLEKGMETLFNGYPNLNLDDGFCTWFSRQVQTMCAHAAHRAATLHEDLPLPSFTGEHGHEMMALVAETARQLAGQKAEEGVAAAMEAWLAGCPGERDWAWRTAGIYHAAGAWLAGHLDPLLAGDIISEARLAFGRKYGQGAAYLPVQMESELCG